MKFNYIVTFSVMMSLNSLYVSSRCFRHRLGCDTSINKGIPQFDTQQFYSTMEQVMQNPQFMNMAEHLDSAMMQDPSMSKMLESLSNPAQKDQLEERMAHIKEDPSLKPIIEEIESGCPTTMMKYWNDQDVLKNLG
ncbi:hypothetical protein Hanom_Chr13g01188471 [Helianthus anomalus]